MSEHLTQAEDGFHGAGGRFSSAFNAAMRANALDASAVTHLLAGLERQSQGFAQLARAVADLDRKINDIKRKLAIP
jgi:hypothetical protein